LGGGWLEGTGGGGGGIGFSMVPVAAFNPKTYNNMVTTTVIKINGIKTIIHETIPKPC